MPESRKRRIMAGLAVAGLMGAAGYGGTKLVQRALKKRRQKLKAKEREQALEQEDTSPATIPLRRKAAAEQAEIRQVMIECLTRIGAYK